MLRGGGYLEKSEHSCYGGKRGKWVLSSIGRKKKDGLVDKEKKNQVTYEERKMV